MDDLVFAALGAALDLVEEKLRDILPTSLARALCREMPRVRVSGAYARFVAISASASPTRPQTHCGVQGRQSTMFGYIPSGNAADGSQRPSLSQQTANQLSFAPIKTEYAAGGQF